MSCDLCENCQKKQIKYTEVEDINNLINEFSGNITGGNRKTEMYMDIYELYYNYIGGLLFEMFSDKSEDCEKNIIEWLWDEDLEEEIREDLNDKQGMIDIYNEYIPLGSGGFNLFDSDIRQTLLEKIHSAYYKLEFEIMVDVFFDIKELFSGRVKNKTFYQLK
jgi:hypothetical protein|tara:strand:- start:747 stop:1235 length:489 start_codon:yes stop_codon:yes gene_type:complete